MNTEFDFTDSVEESDDEREVIFGQPLPPPPKQTELGFFLTDQNTGES